MKTKILSLFLVVVMVFSVFSIAVSAESITEVPSGYVGIYTKDDLFEVHLNTSGKYILMNDIIFDEFDFGEDYNDGMGWIPIESFSGTFDGNGYKISNIRISGDVTYAGFFGTVIKNAIVKNLYIDNINIDVTGSYVGGIAGQINARERTIKDYIISDCMISGYVNGQSYVGGFCGYVDTFGERDSYLLENCCNAAMVTGDTFIGGLIGYQYGDATSGGYEGAKANTSYINKCVNTGYIKGNTAVGGIIGKTYRGYGSGSYGGVTIGGAVSIIYIYDTYNSGSISCLSYGGGIIGSTEYENTSAAKCIQLKNCYNSGLITATDLKNFGALLGTGYSKIDSVYYLDSCATDATKIIGTSITSDNLKSINMGDCWTLAGCKNYVYPELIDVEPIFQLSGTATVTGEEKYGSVLEVTTSSVSPEFADIFVQWIVDGVVVGTDTTYTITENDIGKSIYAKIYSDDCVVGSFSSDSLLITKSEQTNTPDPATIAEKTDTYIRVSVTSGQEYSIDNENWNTTGEFTALDANTEYTVYTRIAETDVYFASEPDDSCKVTTFKEIINVDSATGSEDDKQIVYDNIGNFKTKVFDVITGESEGTSLVRISVPEDFDAESVEVYVFTDGALAEIEFIVNDGFIWFETTASGKFAVVDKSQIVDKEPEEDTTKPEEDTTAPEEDTTKPEEDTTAPEEDTTDDEKNNADECKCMCHSDNAFMRFIYKIIRILRSLLGLNFCRNCKCTYV